MCVICDHRSVADINQDLRDGVPLLRIEQRYGVARASLHRHRDGRHHHNSGVQEIESAVDTTEMEMDTTDMSEAAAATPELEMEDEPSSLVDTVPLYLTLGLLELADVRVVDSAVDSAEALPNAAVSAARKEEAELPQMVPGMWLQRDGQVVFVPEYIPLAIQRHLSEGWVAIPDPRVPTPIGEQDASRHTPAPRLVRGQHSRWDPVDTYQDS